MICFVYLVLSYSPGTVQLKDPHITYSEPLRFGLIIINNSVTTLSVKKTRVKAKHMKIKVLLQFLYKPQMCV